MKISKHGLGMHTASCCRGLLFSSQSSRKSVVAHPMGESSLCLLVNSCLCRNSLCSQLLWTAEQQKLKCSEGEAVLSRSLSHLSLGLICNNNLLTAFCASVLSFQETAPGLAQHAIELQFAFFFLHLSGFNFLL